MAITADLLWLDGVLVSKEAATVPVMGHAPQRGSLVFDAGSFSSGDDGPLLFRAADHVARFLRSTRIVGLEVPFQETDLVRAAIEVAAKTRKDEGLIRWSCFYAATEPDLLPRAARVRVAVAAQILEDPPSTAPIRIAFFGDARKAPPEALHPHAKAAAAYLGPMLARKRAIACGADEVVLLDREGNIAEAPVANVCAVVGGALWTPPVTYVLPGITRDSVLALARDEGIPIREEPLPADVFASANEAFLTGTSYTIAPIGRINDRSLEGPGPVTSRLAARMAAAKHGRDPRFANWVTPLRG